jgi:hypothetical protein
MIDLGVAALWSILISSALLSLQVDGIGMVNGGRSTKSIHAHMVSGQPADQQRGDYFDLSLPSCYISLLFANIRTY